MTRPGTEYRSPEWKRRVSEGLKHHYARKRQVAAVRPRDLARLERSGTVTLALRPLLSIAAEEAYELTEALGGSDALSPQRRMVIEDLTAMGITLRATLALFLQNYDTELASKISALASARRVSLQTLGLDRVAKELDISAYIAQKDAEVRAEAAIGAKSEPVHEPAGVVETAPAEGGATGPSATGGTPTGSAAFIDTPEPEGAES